MKNFDNIFNHERRDGAPREGDFKRRDFGGKKRFGDRDRERPQMHEATCSACGKKCEVPFRPTGDKPVYCSECFSKQGGGNASRSERRSYDRPRFQDKKMFDAVCDKCGKKFELPFRPTGEKPVYCNDCFDRDGSSSTSRGSSQYKEQFDMLNAKLDRLIKVLIPTDPVKDQKKAAVIEKKDEAKKTKKVIVKKPAAKKKKAKR